MEVRRGSATVSFATNYPVSPLMIGGRLLATTGDGSVVALDRGSGAVLWSYVPPDLVRPSPTLVTEPAREIIVGRSVNRGLAYWADGLPGLVTLAK